MPDSPDFFDEARRALDAVPAPDLWDDAQRRAAGGEAVPLTVGSERPRHAGRWLAVAAAAVLAVGAVAVVAMNDDSQPVDTGPLTSPTTGGPTTAGGNGDCLFGVAGDPIVLLPGPADPPLFDGASQALGTTLVHASLGTQTAELQVPGLVVTDLMGERVEQVELRRGPAEVWFGTDFVQVRWFPGSQDDCDSFTVTVTGGTEDGNRHAAVELAERILLPAELFGGSTPVEVVAGEWQLERSTVDGVPTDGLGLTFSFVDGQARWTDGCNDFSGSYEMVGATTMSVLDIAGTKVACPPNPTADAVRAVMGAEQIEVTPGSGRDIVVLSAGTTVLTLVPVAPQTTTSISEGSVGAQPSTAYSIWPITYPGQPQGDWDFAGGTAEETALAYATEALGWRDAVVTDGEPSEDGWSGSRYLVESAESGGAVDVAVRLGSDGDGYIVYGVDVPARLADISGASVLVSGRTARASVVPSPVGTASVGVKFLYGDEVLGEGLAGDDIELTRSPDTPGAVAVHFATAAGRVISVWARPLPAGDFAAS